jgi:hypothetical protein
MSGVALGSFDWVDEVPKAPLACALSFFFHASCNPHPQKEKEN